MNNLKDRKGFTLIELIVVIAIIAVLATVAMPKFVDLSGSAKVSSTKGALGAVRSVLALKYAQSATGGAAASYPAVVSSTDFSDNNDPPNALSGNAGVTAVTSPPSGTATNAKGFWYVTAAGADYGKAGAYSDGTVNTSSY